MISKQKLQFVLLILLWPIFVSAQTPASATDRIDARRISDEIMRATERRDIKGVMRHFTSDVQFQVDGKRFDARTYEERMRTAFPLMSDYRYVRSNEAVNAGSSGDVLFNYRLEEHYNLRGKRIVAASQQTLHMRRQGGQLKVYRVVAR
jgi:ketosteroid isomerase-like protein